MAYHAGSPVQLPDHLLPLASGALEPEHGESDSDKLSKNLIVILKIQGDSKKI